MNKYTVIWADEATEQLTELWLQAADRQVLTRACDSLEKALTYDPSNKGEDYFGDRLIAVPPLWAIYEVEPDDLLARVLRVGDINTGISKN